MALQGNGFGPPSEASRILIGIGKGSTAMSNWKKAGLIGMGAVLGVLLSLNFSAIAQREAKLPIPYEDLQLLSAVFGRIKSDYVEPVSDDKLIKEAINGMVHGLDPHSDFLDAEAFKDLQISTQGKFGGLGIEVGVEDGVVRVVSPIEDTPAFRAGIKSGDLIVKIDDDRDARHAAQQGGREDARQARHDGRADRRAQGRRGAAHVHADARGNQRQERRARRCSSPATATSACASSRTAPARTSRRR